MSSLNMCNAHDVPETGLLPYKACSLECPGCLVGTLALGSLVADPIRTYQYYSEWYIETGTIHSKYKDLFTNS